MDKWVKEDDYAVTMTTVDGEFIPPQWDRALSNNSSLGGIWSKRVFDELGPDGMAETPVGTGPFSVDRWVANQEIILDAQEKPLQGYAERRTRDHPGNSGGSHSIGRIPIR